MIRTLKEWKQYAQDRGTRGEMVWDILKDWEEEQGQAQQEDSADASNQREPAITTDGDPPMNTRKTGDIHG